MATPTRQPKTMSSRLLTMKFMQRAAAATPNSGSNSTTSTPEKPASSNEPPTKRSRLSNGTAHATSPSSPASSPYALSAKDTNSIIRAALEAEEQKRLEALEREGRLKGETRWYLDLAQPVASEAKAVPTLRVVSAGFAALDSRGEGREIDDDDEGEDEDDNGEGMEDGEAEEGDREDGMGGGGAVQVSGRRNFGKFSRVVAARDEDGEDESGTDDSEDDEGGRVAGNGDDVDALIDQGRREAVERAREERRAKKSRDTARSHDLADDRRRKQVNLNRTGGISSGGGNRSRDGGRRRDGGGSFRDSSKRAQHRR